MATHASMRAVKRQKVSPARVSQDTGTSTVNEGFLHHASKWKLEQDYEQRPRKLDKKGKKTQKLPIRTSEGWVEQEAVGSEEEDEQDNAPETVPVEDHVAKSMKDRPTVPPSVEHDPNTLWRQQKLEIMEEIVRLQRVINEDPEENIGLLKKLRSMTKYSDCTIKELALAVPTLVFKHIIPGYRIRPLSEEDMKANLSKDVRKLRTFEQSLVTGYQEYVGDLTNFSQGRATGSAEKIAKLKSRAIQCSRDMLLAVPHFNFRRELLTILIGKLSDRNVDSDFVICRETLEQLFRDDEDGDASLEAVLMLAKMIKARNYRVDESVLNTFLHLRLLSEFSQKGSSTTIDDEEEDDYPQRKSKKKREFRTKRLRKQLREEKKLRKEMNEADAAVSHEDRDKNQAEMLKAVFLTYLRILKAGKQNLMGAVLEGLAKYSHLVNQGFFGDIIATLEELIRQAEEPSQPNSITVSGYGAEGTPDEEFPTRNATRESLLCVITAFALLRGQDTFEAVIGHNIHLSRLSSHLYRILVPLALNPDIESSARPASPCSSTASSPPTSPASGSRQHNKVNADTSIVLLLKALKAILLPPPPANPDDITRDTLASFTHQILLAALQLPASSANAIVKLLKAVTARKMPAWKVAELWNTEERKGDGVCNLATDVMQESNPHAGTVWEGELLRMHYDPRVREEWEGVMVNIRKVRK
ncbi:nucleolar complex-associated protein 3 [Viridothelium virens]|uniref:Nucleolar complex-associated protein 3 n=1 Tax=Viridothelium virens TaxID=1048519 RepID=A0A6A6H454_VIRVR|nr:nucleolar complex-associated protein 3 [Viridothelium virens]